MKSNCIIAALLLVLSVSSFGSENVKNKKDLGVSALPESKTNVSAWLSIKDITPKGEYYDAVVPDTLDLAQRAKLSVSGLTEILDPEDNYSTYCHTYYNTNPAYMTRHWVGGKAQNWGKIVEALILVRNMCGSRENLDIEYKTIQGLVDFAKLKQKEPYPTPLSRIMLALIALNEVSPKPEIKGLLGEYAQSHVNLAKYDGGYAYYYDGPPDLKDTELGVQGYWMQAFVNGTAIRTLCQWHKMSENIPVMSFIEKLKSFLIKPVYWHPEASPKVVVGSEQAHFSGHTHSYTQALMGLIHYAELTNDVRLKEFVRSGYEYIRNFGIPRIGLFGEGGCGTGDMTYLAIKLSDWGVGDYWEDVDQYTRNHLTELQYRDADLMQKVVNTMPKLDPNQSEPVVETTDDVVNRAVGIYFSDGSHPALIPEHTLISVICCTGNGTKALHAVWESIVRCKDGVAQINLLLNRASPWLDINSYLPYEGKVVITNKTAQKLSVRIPKWVKREDTSCKVNNKSKNLVWIGNYLHIDELSSGDIITIEFPMVETTEKYTLKWKENDFWKENTNPGSTWEPLEEPDVFTCKFKGNTLVEISPRPDRPGYPLYKRNYLRSNKAKMKKVRRFISSVSKH